MRSCIRQCRTLVMCVSARRFLKNVRKKYYFLSFCSNGYCKNHFCKTFYNCNVVKTMLFHWTRVLRLCRACWLDTIMLILCKLHKKQISNHKPVPYSSFNELITQQTNAHSQTDRRSHTRQRTIHLKRKNRETFEMRNEWKSHDFVHESPNIHIWYI